MPHSQLINERSLYIGSYISGIFYGVQLLMFFMSTYYMLKTPHPHKHTKIYILYGFVLLVLLTVDITCNAVFGQLMWIEHRNVPGGPAAYMRDNFSLWINTLGTTSGATMNFMGDALLLYRCYIFWDARFRVVAFPLILFVGSTTMSILTVIESAQPGTSFFRGRSVDFGVPYVTLSVTLNIIVTLLICRRLFAMRKQINATLNPDHAKTYTSIAAMLVESAAPFTIAGIAYAISYARHSPTGIAFVQIWGKFCAFSPQLIILRVAMGQAWSQETVNSVSRLRYHSDRRSDGTEIAIELSRDRTFASSQSKSPESFIEQGRSMIQ